MFSKLKKLFKGVELPKHQNDEGRPEKATVTVPRQHDPVAEVATATENPPAVLRPEELKRNRKGMRVIGKHQDMADFFAEVPQAGDVSDRLENIAAEPSANPYKPLPATSSKRKIRQPRKTRNGLPILDGRDDFSLFLEMESAGSEKKGPAADSAGPSAGKGEPVEELSVKNRHGIPFLPLNEAPGPIRKNGSESDKGEFLRLLNSSLGQKTRDVMMREKGVKTSRIKPLTLKQKLARYPMPQGQLDLHGYTAIRAEFRAETYLKHANASQLHTVMIIVGKGIHSDEGAVLPDVIETLLNKLRKDGLVLSYEWENEKKSRSGAVTVYLNNLAFD